MKLYRGLGTQPDLSRGSVATIGNFDGVHRGHQALLGRLTEAAKINKLPAVVVTFEPLPAAWFDPDNAPPRITPLPEKLAALRDCGVDAVWLLRFNAGLANLSADAFIEQVLIAGLNVRAVLVGDDFRFGHNREGDLALLERAGERAGFSAHAMASVTDDGARISSSAIRDALDAGDLGGVRNMLGRSYALCGRVVRGDQIGRQLGYPTANLTVHHRLALAGVFAVQVAGITDDVLAGVASLGTRPTVGGERLLLEVHLFDYSGNLYGKRLNIIFIKKLRDEHHFDSIEDMVAQMRADAGDAKKILAQA